MSIIIAALALVAVYCGGMWVFVVVQAMRGAVPHSPEVVENHTFHLGLCFVLSLGFLGLILGGS